MTIDLFHMTDDEYPSFVATMESRYAQSLSSSGRLTEDEAVGIASKTIVRLFPDGLSTPNCHFFSIREAADAPALGQVALGLIPVQDRTIGQIWYICVDEAHRRKGIATKALLVLEQRCRSLGVDQLDLQVFAFNKAAIALYQKAGYESTNIFMSKRF